MKKTTENLPAEFKAISGIVAALTALSVAAALFGAVLYYTALMNNFDTAIGHFSSGGVVTGFIACLAVSAILAIASGAIMTRRTAITGSGSYSTPVVGSFVVLGGLLAASAVLKLREILPTFADSVFAKNSVMALVKENIIALAAPLFALVAAAYFIMISGGKKVERARAVLSIPTVIWVLLSTLSVYFESGRPINSPIKAILLTLSMINMLFITEDARFLIRTQKAPLYRAICMLCVCFGLVFAIPDLAVSILSSAGVSSSAIFSSPDGIFSAMNFDLLNSAVSAMIPVCAAARLLTFNSCCGEYIKPKHEKQKAACAAADTADASPTDTSSQA